MRTSGYVWIVTVGELCQGGSVHGVFLKLEHAEQYVARELPNFRKDDEQSTCFVSYHDSSDWAKIAAHRVRHSSH